MNQYSPSYPENQGQRSPCLLVLDVSAFMAAPARHTGESGLDALQQGLDVLGESLQKDPSSAHRVQLSIMAAGGPRDDPLLLLDWVDAADFHSQPFQPGGSPRMAQAMRLALHHVEQHKQMLRRSGIAYTRPWIMVVSGGMIEEPAGVWESVAQDCRQAERDKRCVIFPIVLDGADGKALQMISVAQVATLSTMRLQEFFTWLSAALASTSRSVPGVSVVLPAVDKWAVFRR